MGGGYILGGLYVVMSPARLNRLCGARGKIFLGASYDIIKLSYGTL